MISILCPTRNRPTELCRMVESVVATVTRPAGVEVLFYVDDDDVEVSLPIINELAGRKYVTGKVRVDAKTGPRQVLTQCWNELLSLATGELLMQGNDDIVFRTPGWDALVEQAFERQADKIILVHGSDGGMHFENFGPHPIVHRRWVDAVGYFIPPYFSSDFGDTWLNELANHLERRRYVPFVAEHLHFLMGKAEKDQTTLERLARHARDNPTKIYADRAAERQEQVERLRGLMVLSPEEKKKWEATPRCPRCRGRCVVQFSGITRCNSCGYQERRPQPWR